MTTRHSIQLAILTLLLLAGAVRAAESLSVLLQKGIFAEETEGNLDAAIRIYQKIADDADANRSVVAQAHYRLGVCELKRGKKAEAEAAFRKIVERFSGETELLAKTRERLKELGNPEGSVVIRQVWAPKIAVDTEGSITPDGRYLSFTDWTSGDLAVRDLTTGQNRRLTDKGPLEKSREFAETSVFSPDGKYVAYGWYPQKGDIQLRFLSLDDSNPRVLMTNSWVRPEAWSPKGDYIAVSGSDLYSASVDFDSGKLIAKPRQIVTRFAGLKARVSFSPDGRVLAFTRLQGERPILHVMDLESGQEREFSNLPDSEFHNTPAWLPDNRNLLFRSMAADQRGRLDLLDIVTGELKPIANDEPGVSLEFLAGAKGENQTIFYIRRESERKQFVLVRRDFKSGMESKQDVLPMSNPNANYTFALDGDQRWLGFLTAERNESGESLFRVARRNLQTGEEVEVIRSNYFIEPRPNAGVRQLAAGIRNENGERAVRFFDLTTQPPREQFAAPFPKEASLGWWTPDSRYLLFEKRTGTSGVSKTEVWTISSHNGELKRTELSAPNLKLAFVYPDGKQVCFQAGASRVDEVWVMENFLPPVASAK